MPVLQFSEGGPELPSQLAHRKQLLNHLVDGMARTRPNSVWAKIPVDDTSYEAGYRKLTYKLMANAVNGLAWWLEQNLGRSENFETLAYFGTWDPRHILLLLAAVKTGYKMLFPSMMWSGPGLTHLLDGLDCKTVLISSMDLPINAAIMEDEKKGIKEIPTLATLLETQYDPYPFDKAFETCKSEPLMVVHTSGTTGLPKPLIYTHDWAASWILRNQMDPPPGFDTLEHMLHAIEFCAIAPPNHISSFLPNFFGTISNQSVTIYPLPQASLSLETAVAMIRHNSPDMLLAPPFVLDALAADADLMTEFSSKFSMIGFGGAPLSKHSGDILAQKFQLFNLFGTSEIGSIHKVAPSAVTGCRNWSSIIPHPMEDMQFRHLCGNSFEAVIVRNAHEDQPVFKLFPELDEWRLKDVFVPDPAHKGSWIYEGRVDDILIFSNGGTVNPLGFEQYLALNPLIGGAMMCGTGRLQPALLIELVEGQDCFQEVTDTIWSVVEECNGQFPPQATIKRSHIILTAPEKPLPRTAKGTFQRKKAVEIYQEELDRLYRARPDVAEKMDAKTRSS